MREQGPCSDCSATVAAGRWTDMGRFRQGDGAAPSRAAVRMVRFFVVVLWAAVFAALCVIGYHVSYGMELYRRGQEHAAAEISMAAQKAGAALAFSYEEDALCVVLLRRKGSFTRARTSAAQTDVQEDQEVQPLIAHHTGREP